MTRGQLLGFALFMTAAGLYLVRELKDGEFDGDVDFGLGDWDFGSIDVMAILSGQGATTVDNTAVDVVARTIWGEARSEGYDGMKAVANVIANRVASPSWWGSGWVSVCQKDRQFSCWNVGDPNRPRLLAVTAEDDRFAACLNIASAAVSGHLPDITGGATHYHADYVTPSWASSLTKTVQIGRHIFYK
ncbi:MAG: cell wall hydrolase [Magnetospiraceae bacterium]